MQNILNIGDHLDTPDTKKTFSRHAAQGDPSTPDGSPVAAESHRVHVSQEAARRSAIPVHEEYDEQWKPPMRCDAPDPMPGFVQRWVRFISDGMDDPQNVNAAQREGWQIRPAESLSANDLFTRLSHPVLGGIISNGDSILMMRSTARQQAYDRHFQHLADRRVRGVAQYIQTQGMPSVQNQGRLLGSSEVSEFDVTRGRAKLPRVADD